MPAVGAVPAATRIAGRLGHAGNGFAAALGEEDRKLALGVLPTANRTGDGGVGLSHRPDGFEDFLAILAFILVNWHRLLYIMGCGSTLNTRIYFTAFRLIRVIPPPNYLRLKSAGISPQAWVSHFRMELA